MKDDAEAVGADRSGEGQLATGSGGHEGQPASGEGQAATAPAAPGLANQKDSDLALGTLVTTRATKERAKWDNQSAKIIGALANMYKVQLLTGPEKGTIKKYAKRCVFAAPEQLAGGGQPADGGVAPAGGGDAPAGGGGASISGGGAVSSGGGDASRNAADSDDDDAPFAAFS